LSEIQFEMFISEHIVPRKF